jgi:hypothetical protein
MSAQEQNVKLTSEELDFIKNGTAQYNAVKSKIGDFEIQKAKLINEADAIVKSFLIHEKILIEKYGENAIINMETGEVTQKQD